MPLALPSSSDLLRLAETLIIATVGGFIFSLTGFPAGLVSGSVIAVAVAALLGRPVAVPLPLARLTYLLIGISLGAVVTPDTIKGIANWPLNIVILAISTTCMMLATTCYLRFVHGWDAESALFGASPGALAQSMALAAEYGADLRAIAIVQTMRVVILTVGLPAGLGLFGLAGKPVPRPATALSLASAPEIGLLVATATLSGLFLVWLRFPGGLMFGAMIGSAILHGSGWIHAVLPSWVANSAVVLIGAICGARFANTTFRMLLSHIGAAIGSFAVAIAVVTAFVIVLTHALPVHIADVVIAFAPGAQDTMMVLALALHLDPVYVGAHHLSRFMIVSLSVPVLARRARANAPHRPETQWRRPERPSYED